MRMQAQWVAVTAALVSLYGCGGGGGGGNQTPSTTYTVGGAVSGLAGSGLVLTLNGGADLTVSSAGTFTFPNGVASGSSYAVAVKTQPVNPHQTCVATSASGSVSNAAISNVAVSCSTNSYGIGGAVSGLAGSGLVLALNGDVEVAVGVNGNLTFPGTLPSGTSYAVTVKSQPAVPHQTCAVTNSSGAVGGNVVTNVSVSCATNTFAVGGSVSGLSGSGLVLRSNGIDLPVSASGAFTFPSPLASGASYSLTIVTQPVSPNQTCVATNFSGVVGNVAPDVAVTCTTDTYSVGGTVSGLTGTGLTLRLNGAQDLPISNDGSFTFPSPLLSGVSYTVTIGTQTSNTREVCVARGASGVGTTTNITTVSVDCAVVLGFVYTVNSSGQVLKYGIHPTAGDLLPMGTAGTVGSQTRYMVAAPDGSALYATDASSNTIYSFSVDSNTGTLGALGTPLSTGGVRPYQLAIAPSGDFLYAANSTSGTIAMFSIDPVTRELVSQGIVATAPASGASGEQSIAITPDGAFLYLLSSSNSTPASVTVYSVNTATGALAAGTTTATPGMTGLTLDPLGRFLYLRESVIAFPPTSVNSTLYPYAIDAVTGALTPLGINPTVPSNSADMLIEPSGRYAYLLSTFNGVEQNHVATLAINQSTGALSVIGTRAVIQDPSSFSKLASDAAGQFLFVSNIKSPGTFDPSAPYDGSTLVIQQTGPTTGRASVPGSGPSVAGWTGAIAVIE